MRISRILNDRGPPSPPSFFVLFSSPDAALGTDPAEILPPSPHSVPRPVYLLRGDRPLSPDPVFSSVSFVTRRNTVTSTSPTVCVWREWSGVYGYDSLLGPRSGDSVDYCSRIIIIAVVFVVVVVVVAAAAVIIIAVVVVVAIPCLKSSGRSLYVSVIQFASGSRTRE